ncbi:MAG: nickel-dependent lactate racemase [Archaeoglobi archaeon]|nr:nickel-dependent lactate racemase [Candidatus Mnemosynella bozhongmuii]
MRIELKFGKGTLSAEVPEENITEFIYPEELDGIEDVRGEVLRCISNPIDSAPLEELVKGKEKIAILVSDITRPCPTGVLLPPVLEVLKRAGVRRENVTIIFGLGTHRKHTEEEKRRIVGDEIYENYRCLDSDLNDVVNLGETSRGTPVEVFRPVAEADFIMCIGNIEFHYFAGYSGGVKPIVAGVGSKSAIEKNHMLMIEKGAEAGNLESPVRKDMEEFASIVGVDFILNVVLNSREEIVRVVAGDPVEAHREGAKTVDSMYKRRIREKSDVVLCSAGGYPNDINLYQVQKAIDNVKRAVRKEGTIVITAECPEGFGNEIFERWMTEHRYLEEFMRMSERVRREFTLGGHKAASLSMIMKHADIMLVTRMPEERVRRAFFEYAGDLQDALRQMFEKYGRDLRITVVPFARTTLCVE